MRNPVPSAPQPPGVAVVGAGFAGLSAAYRLHRWGVPTLVLEARDRVGGRVLTTRLDGGGLAELGAEWIEERETALHDLARELGLDLVPTGVDYRRREAPGPLGASLDEQQRALAVARAELDRRPPERGDSLGAFVRSLPLSEPQRETLRARLQGTFARDLEHVTLRVAERGTFGGGPGRYVRVASGNQSVADVMAARLPDVRLRHVVERVRVREEGLLVEGTAPDGPFSLPAGAIVVAVPAPLAAALRFDPPLPREVHRALRELPMGVASKLAVETAGEPSLRALQEVSVPFWCWVALGEEERPRRMVTAFAGSEEAQRTLATFSGDAGPWMRRLRRLNPDLEFTGEPVLKSWGDDPFARGCYSCFDDAGWDRRSLLAEPVGRVAFAGEHTAGLSSGTMNGAVESGNRAATWARDLLAVSA